MVTVIRSEKHKVNMDKQFKLPSVQYVVMQRNCTSTSSRLIDTDICYSSSPETIMKRPSGS